MLFFLAARTCSAEDSVDYQDVVYCDCPVIVKVLIRSVGCAIQEVGLRRGGLELALDCEYVVDGDLAVDVGVAFEPLGVCLYELEVVGLVEFAWARWATACNQRRVAPN